MLERAERASHIDPPASSYAIMHRASPYCGENPGPGKDVHGELDPTPGIREQPGSFSSDRHTPDAHGMSASLRKQTCARLPRYVRFVPIGDFLRPSGRGQIWEPRASASLVADASQTYVSTPGRFIQAPPLRSACACVLRPSGTRRTCRLFE